MRILQASSSVRPDEASVLEADVPEVEVVPEAAAAAYFCDAAACR